MVFERKRELTSSIREATLDREAYQRVCEILSFEGNSLILRGDDWTAASYDEVVGASVGLIRDGMVASAEGSVAVGFTSTRRGHTRFTITGLAHEGPTDEHIGIKSQLESVLRDKRRSRFTLAYALLFIDAMLAAVILTSHWGRSDWWEDLGAYRYLISLGVGVTTGALVEIFGTVVAAQKPAVVLDPESWHATRWGSPTAQNACLFALLLVLIPSVFLQSTQS